jgi:hypothetical protein
MKKRLIKINISNRWRYTLIALGIILIISVGIYALTPGVVPIPGHSINDFAPPATCVAGQFLQWNGATWVCSGF